MLSDKERDNFNLMLNDDIPGVNTKDDECQ